MSIIVSVQSVEVHHAQQDTVFYIPRIDVVEINSCRIVFVHYAQFEIIFRKRTCSQRVNVFHHQIPHIRATDYKRRLEQLNYQSLRSIDAIGREFPHTIHFAPVCVLERHG